MINYFGPVHYQRVIGIAEVAVVFMDNVYYVVLSHHYQDWNYTLRNHGNIHHEIIKELKCFSLESAEFFADLMIEIYTSSKYGGGGIS